MDFAHTRFIGMYRLYGNLKLRGGGHQEAVAYYDRAIEIAKNFCGENSEETALLYCDQSLVFEAQKRFSEAIQNLTKGMEIWERYGSFDSVRSELLNRLLRFYNQAGEVTPAAEVRALLKDNFAEPARNLAGQNMDNDTGLTAQTISQLSEELESSIWETGPEDTGNAALHINLGTAYLDKNDYENALACFTDALKLVTPLEDKPFPDVGEYYIKKAGEHFVKGEFSLTLEYLQKTLNFYQTMVGTVNVKVADICERIGNFHISQGDYMQAHKSFGAGADINHHLFGSNHPLTLNSLILIGRTFAGYGDSDSAAEIFEQVEVLNQTGFSDEQLLYTYICEDLAKINTLKGDDEEALKCLEMGSCFLNNLLGDQKRIYAKLQAETGKAALKKENYFQAKACFLSFLETADDERCRIPSKDQIDITGKLIDVYRLLKDAEKEEVYRARKEDLLRKDLTKIEAREDDFQHLQRWFQHEHRFVIDKAESDKQLALADEHESAAKHYEDTREFGLAAENYLAALRILTAELGTSRRETIGLHHRLGIVYRLDDQPLLAVDEFKKFAEGVMELAGNTDPLIASCYEDISAGYAEVPDLDAALKYGELALVIRRMHQQDTPEALGGLLQKLGDLHREAKDHERALKRYLEVYDIYTAHFGSGDEKTAEAGLNIGIAYYELNESEKSLAYLDAALKVRQHLFGSFDERTAEIVRQLGHCYYDLGDAELAADNYRKALVYYQDDRGDNTWVLSNLLFELGQANTDLKRYTDAVINFKEALVVRENLYGKDHKKSLSALYELAWLYDYSDESELALETIDEFIRRNKISEAAGNRRLGDVFQLKGLILKDNKDFSEAFTAFHEACTFRSLIPGLKSKETAKSLFECGYACRKMKRLEESTTYFKQSLDVYHSLPDDESDAIAKICRFIGINYFEEDDPINAEIFYLKALQLKTEKNLKDIEAGHTCYNLGDLYRKKGDERLARQYYSEALKTYHSLSNKPLNLIGELELILAEEK